LRRTNLLPPQERRGRRPSIPTTTRTSAIGIRLILGALLVMIMIGLYLYYFVRLGNEEEQITQLEQDIARQQARVQELAPFENLQARLDAKKPIADGIFRTHFPWDEFLRGLAFVIPDSTELDTFVGKAAPINTRSPEVQILEPLGSITFNGIALPEFQNVSDFIVRMNNLRSLANTQLARAELNRETFSRDAITFEVGADLITRVGENGNEVLIGSERDNGEGGDGEEDGPQGDQASRLARVER
jgi:type IV pilus assembly protein PilN